jgi:hypothetical protein
MLQRSQSSWTPTSTQSEVRDVRQQVLRGGKRWPVEAAGGFGTLLGGAMKSRRGWFAGPSFVIPGTGRGSSEKLALELAMNTVGPEYV